MREHTVRWQGVDDPDRFDISRVSMGERLSAQGSSRTKGYTLHYALQTGPRYETSRTWVDVAARRWWRSLELERDGTHWRATTEAEGDPAADGLTLAAPGVSDPVSLTSAVDCDLGLCPVTNTMPMLRSVLPRASSHGEQTDLSVLSGLPGPEISFVMAWIEVPSLSVQRSEQVYQLRAKRDDGSWVVRYIGLHRSFVGDLTVDADGLVIDYPELARRVSWDTGLAG